MKTVFVEDDLHNDVKIQCAIEKKSIKEVIEVLLKKWLVEQENKNDTKD